MTENGALGMPAQAPWEIGNLKVIRFNPIGGFNSITVPFGRIFLNQQLIDFAAYDKGISDA